MGTSERPVISPGPRDRSWRALTAVSLLAVLLVVLATRAFAQGPTGSLKFSFTLKSSPVTSADAYRADGRLGRTLWSKKPYGVGTHTENWGGLDDAGKEVAAGEYTITLLYHNVQYVWEGVIGNTSAEFTGNSVHGSLAQPTGLAIAGSSARVRQRLVHQWHVRGQQYLFDRGGSCLRLRDPGKRWVRRT